MDLDTISLWYMIVQGVMVAIVVCMTILIIYTLWKTRNDKKEEVD